MPRKKKTPTELVPFKAVHQPVKTLRDEFAMAALTGLLASAEEWEDESEELAEAEEFSKAAYVYADRMLAARKTT